MALFHIEFLYVCIEIVIYDVPVFYAKTLYAFAYIFEDLML